MSNVIQIKRGSGKPPFLADGELGFETKRKNLYIGYQGGKYCFQRSDFWLTGDILKAEKMIPDNYEDQGHNTEIYLKGVAKFCAKYYPGEFVSGLISPNSQGSFSMYTYRGTPDPQTGFMAYSTGEYSALHGFKYFFGTINNVWYFKLGIDASNYSDYALPLSGGTLTGPLTVKDIIMEAPETSGGWNVGSWVTAPATKRQAGIGYFGRGNNLQAIYLGFGESPWGAGSLGLHIYKDKIVYNNKNLSLDGHIHDNRYYKKQEIDDKIKDSELGERNLLLYGQKPQVVYAANDGTDKDNYNYAKYSHFSRPFIPGKTYTASAKIKVLKGNFNRVSIYFYPGGDVESCLIGPEGDVSFTTSNTTKEINSVLFYAGRIGSTRGNSIEISEVSVREGHRSIGWNYAPEEIPKMIADASLKSSSAEILASGWAQDSSTGLWIYTYNLSGINANSNVIVTPNSPYDAQTMGECYVTGHDCQTNKFRMWAVSKPTTNFYIKILY